MVSNPAIGVPLLGDHTAEVLKELSDGERRRSHATTENAQRSTSRVTEADSGRD